ncbi:hypothetical protein PR048_004211 [Dryococelus australis]|uniref:Uncharacterized protein n=1 Tax=Dryococelus australis TaxID=614101 RepID=A0ABQ9I5B3_9NEOP|nr:hypothetical protein PR048_004211 [Dryococelus australis]
MLGEPLRVLRWSSLFWWSEEISRFLVQIYMWHLMLVEDGQTPYSQVWQRLRYMREVRPHLVQRCTWCVVLSQSSQPRGCKSLPAESAQERQVNTRPTSCCQDSVFVWHLLSVNPVQLRGRLPKLVIFKRDADLLENWIVSREPILHDKKLGESIPQVEELIRKHEDFEKTVAAQEEKLTSLRRITLQWAFACAATVRQFKVCGEYGSDVWWFQLEETFQKQQQAEQAARQVEKERLERERLEARKRREVQRITDERRREDERRRQQEVRSPREEMNGADVPDSNTSRVLALEVPEPGPLQKSGSISQLFGDQMRRVDVNDASYAFCSLCLEKISRGGVSHTASDIRKHLSKHNECKKIANNDDSEDLLGKDACSSKSSSVSAT